MGHHQNVINFKSLSRIFTNNFLLLTNLYKFVSVLLPKVQSLIAHKKNKILYNIIMEDKVKFNELMAEIFGTDWKDVKTDGSTNNFIRALNGPSNFDFFKSCFRTMVTDLKGLYAGNIQETRKLINTIREVSNEKNCYGAYSELCALHLLNLSDFSLITTDNSLPANESFASVLGHKSVTNMDGYISDIGLYFDTKAFRDTITPLLKNVTDTALTQLKNSEILGTNTQPRIQYQFPSSESEEFVKQNFKGLVEEFTSKFEQRIKHISSDLIPNLTYILNWGGVTSSVSSYSPFERAENLVEPFFVRYADKFLLKEPFMLVMVNHPWFNQIDSDTFSFNEILYRALSRRIFMQFRYDNKKMSEINSKFQSNYTIDTVSQCLSGIMFIDVHSVVDKGYTYKWYIYANPRASRPIRLSPYFDLLQKGKGHIDDFSHDNY